MFAIILTVVFIFMTAYSFVSIKSTTMRPIVCLAYFSAIFFVWNPDLSTKIANLFGIGRGLDFFMILLFVAIINSMILVAQHIHSQHMAITKLARSFALSRAQKQTPHDCPD